MKPSALLAWQHVVDGQTHAAARSSASPSKWKQARTRLRSTSTEMC